MEDQTWPSALKTSSKSHDHGAAAGDWLDDLYCAADAGNFLLGYIFSVSVLTATGIRGESVRLRNAPRQLYNLVAYTVYLATEVLSAGVKVSRVILSPSLPINPGHILG